MLNVKGDSIITFDGSIAKKRDCRYIKGDFYEMNRQCFNIEGRWYRINSGYVVFDYEIGSYVLRNSSLVRGIVGVEDSDWKIGFFSENPAKNVIVQSGVSEIIAISEEIVKERGYVEIQFGTKDLFISEQDKRTKYLSLPRVRPYKAEDNLLYNAKDLIVNATEEYRKYYFPHKKPQEYSPFISPLECKRLLGTFGIEFESQEGRIPARFLYRLGLMALRDGSIVGDEYATIPLSGTLDNMKTLEDIMDIMKTYVKIDTENSLHIHVCLEKFSKEFFLSAYAINTLLESEIFSMFPAFYCQTSKFKRSGKDYNNALPDIPNISKKDPIKSVFPELYYIFSGGHSFEELRGRTDINHPMDSSGTRKWQISLRYGWVNFIPLLFGGSGTIEYRIHPPTLNFYKVLAWVYITNAILHYAKLCMHEICDPKSSILEYYSEHSFNLKDIVNAIYPEGSTSRNLCISYIDYRKGLRSKLDKMGDGSGIWEIAHDHEFVPH